MIDVGINYVPDESHESGIRLVGNVDFENVRKVAGAITPVPGGVGPIAVACLLQNTLVAAQESLAAIEGSWKLKHLPLKVLRPVPSDIAIASAQRPRPVSSIAESIGILDAELDKYGKYKGKVSLSILERLKHRKNGKVRCSDGHHTDTTWRRKIDNYHWLGPGALHPML